MESTPTYPTSIRSLGMLSSYLRYVVLMIFFRLSHQDALSHYLLPPVCHVPHQSYPSSCDRPDDNLTRSICCESPLYALSLHSSYLVLLMPKCRPQHPVLEQPQPAFFLFGRDCVRQNYISVYFNFHVFG